MGALMFEAVIDEGRRLAESFMVDTCEIRAGAGDPVFDPSTGQYTPPTGTLIYTGVCKRQTMRRFEQTSELGAAMAVESRLQLHLPMSAPKIPEGSLVTMLTCPLDPVNVGQKFYVNGPAGKTFATAQRLNVTEVVR